MERIRDFHDKALYKFTFTLVKPVICTAFIHQNGYSQWQQERNYKTKYSTNKAKYSNAQQYSVT